MQQITTPAGQDLATVTEAQIVAAQLRLKAADLIRLAEQLEATAPSPKRQRRSKQPTISLVEMVKQKTIYYPAYGK